MFCDCCRNHHASFAKRHKIPRRISGDAAELFFAAIVIIRKSKQGRCHRDSSRHERCPHHKADAQDSLCVQSSFYHSFMRLIREQIQRPLLLCGRETHHCNTAQHSGQEASGSRHDQRPAFRNLRKASQKNQSMQSQHDHRKGPDMRILQNLQFPLSRLVGMQGITGI